MSSCIAVVNRAPGLADRDVAFWSEACNLQAREIADMHGFEYSPVVFFASADSLPADCRILTISPDLDVPDALGYHDDAGGVVFAEVKFTGAPTSITMSHEIAEEMGDPTCDLWVPFDPDHEQAAELADRVEGDSYLQPVTVLGETRQVPVSNYLLPSAFDASKGAPFDRLGLLKERTGMTAGGYVILRDITTGKVGNVFAARRALPRIISGPNAGAVLAEKLAKRGSRVLRRLRG